MQGVGELVPSGEGKKESNLKIEEKEQDSDQEESKGERKAGGTERVKSALVRGEFLRVRAYLRKSERDDGQHEGEDYCNHEDS